MELKIYISALKEWGNKKDELPRLDCFHNGNYLLNLITYLSIH